MTNSTYTLVLRKLKKLILSGQLKVEDGVRYVYAWDEGKTLQENLKSVRNEDTALLYFMQVGVVEADHDENLYRKQQLQGYRDLGEDHSLWADWDEADPAYREYEYATEIYGIYPDKFRVELEKFGLEDAGIQLAEKHREPHVDSPPTLPKVTLSIADTFSLHEGGLISHKGRLIELEPQVNKIVAFIMERSRHRQPVSLKAIIDECLSEDYLDKAGETGDEQRVDKYVRRCISKARAAFRAATGLSKDFFPNKHSVGYTFNP